MFSHTVAHCRSDVCTWPTLRGAKHFNRTFCNGVGARSTGLQSTDTFLTLLFTNWISWRV